MNTKAKINVILIDDNATTNFISRKHFSKFEVIDEIIDFQSSSLALEYLRNNPNRKTPHLIMLDINMPGMNGWEFMDQYNQLHQDNVRNSVLIILSSTPNPLEQKRARETKGVSEMLLKPLTKENITKILNHYFKSI